MSWMRTDSAYDCFVSSFLYDERVNINTVSSLNLSINLSFRFLTFVKYINIVLFMNPK